MNRWKIAFFCLTTVVVSSIVVVVILLSKGSENEASFERPSADGEPIFFIETSKERLNYLIQSQLESLKYNRNNFDFTVELDDFVNVNGYITAFHKKLRFRMQLQPIVQKNGNLLLRQQVFYIGELPIPSKQVLKFISSSVHLPKWVIVIPEEGVIYIALDQIEVSDNLRVKVKSLDLKNDDFLFEIYEPYSISQNLHKHYARK